MFLSGVLLIASLAGAWAIDLDIKSPESIDKAASTVAANIFANPNITDDSVGVGILNQEVYWWAAGATWSGFIDYWSYTGDSQYNDRVSKALVAQLGPDNNFMPLNQTKSEGNSDQGESYDFARYGAFRPLKKAPSIPESNPSSRWSSLFIISSCGKTDLCFT